MLRPTRKNLAFLLLALLTLGSFVVISVSSNAQQGEFVQQDAFGGDGMLEPVTWQLTTEKVSGDLYR